MNLTITDSGDPSVGISATEYKIECPFNREDNGG